MKQIDTDTISLFKKWINLSLSDSIYNIIETLFNIEVFIGRLIITVINLQIEDNKVEFS